MILVLPRRQSATGSSWESWDLLSPIFLNSLSFLSIKNAVTRPWLSASIPKNLSLHSGSAKQLKQNDQPDDITSWWKSVSDFRLVHGMPLCQGSCMDPIWPETVVGKIIGARPPEIGAPVTPGVSHGTKIFGSKIFSYHPQMMLFYAFWGFFTQKMPKKEKKGSFYALFLIFYTLFSRSQSQLFNSFDSWYPKSCY